MTEIELHQGHAVALPATPDTDSWVGVLQPVADLAGKIAATDFVPKDFRGKTAAVAAAILFGREVGLPPMTTLKNTYVVHGTPDLSAEAQRALVLAAGHEIEFVEATATRCKMRGRRAGSEHWTEAQYTMDEARQSGDAKKNPNYGTRPVEMLIARCTSRLCSMAFPDVIGGFSSAINAPLPHGEVDEVAPEPVKTTVVREPAPAAEPPKPKPRKRVPKPAPIEAAPAPESAPMDGPPLPGEDGFDDFGAAPEPVEPEVADAGPLRTDAQSRKMFALLRELGIADRDSGLQMLSDIIGEPVESSKDLTKAQASHVIETLAGMVHEQGEVIDGEVME